MARVGKRSQPVGSGRRGRHSPVELLMAGFGVLVLVLVVGMIVSALLAGR